MQSFFSASWNVLLELAPWLLLGTVVAGLLHILLPADFLKRHLVGSRGVIKAVIFGVPLPLCSCGVVPVGMSLKKGGSTDGATVAFLISTPQTGVDSIFVSASMLGWPFAIFKVLSAAVNPAFFRFLGLACHSLLKGLGQKAVNFLGQCGFRTFHLLFSVFW